MQLSSPKERVLYQKNLTKTMNVKKIHRKSNINSMFVLFFVLCLICSPVTLGFVYVKGPHRSQSMHALPSSYSRNHNTIRFNTDDHSQIDHCELFSSDAALQIPPTRSSSKSCNDTQHLERRVLILEKLITELCGAIIYSDDIAMSERQISQCGKIYRDTTFKEIRKPVLVRSSIQQVLGNRGLCPIPKPHSWYLDPEEQEKK